MIEPASGNLWILESGLNTKRSRPSCRSLWPTSQRGITVVEVLVSMVVAMIGVLGIMILIPFSVGQVQTAFDFEMANRLARNAANEFEIKAFDRTDRWRRYPLPATISGVAGATARAYMVDPIAVAERVGSNPSQTSGFFPFVDPALVTAMTPNISSAIPFSTSVSADKSILIERVSVEPNAAGNAILTPGLARWHFSWRHDTQTQTPTRNDIVGSLYPTVDLAPPQQVFDSNTLGFSMRRQSVGEMSYTVLSLPSTVFASPSAYPVDAELPGRSPEIGNQDAVSGFRNFIMVYKQRPLPVDFVAPAPQPFYDRIYEAIHPMLNPPSTNPLHRMAVSGGTIRLSPSTLAINNSNNLSAQRADIQRGDWMALTNVYFDPQVNRVAQAVDFYLVLDAVEDGVDWVVTLQGPDFDFQLARDSAGVLDPAISPAAFAHYAPSFQNGPPARYLPSRTYAIHLPDVWAVVERTYQ